LTKEDIIEIDNILQCSRSALIFVSRHQPEYEQLEIAIKRVEEYFKLGIKHKVQRKINEGRITNKHPLFNSKGRVLMPDDPEWKK